MYKSEEIAERVLQTLNNPASVGLGAEPQQVIDIITELAADYSQACARVNDLLRRAREHSSAGNAAEAFRIVKLFHVEDDYQNLKLGGQDQRWRLFCDDYGFPVSDPLDENSHQEVLCLYEVYDQIKDKLKEFRTLSLRRAPLKERLALLRQLASTDMGNALWSEMAGLYEKSRDEEIERRFSALPKTKENASEAFEMLRELTDINRVTPFPEAIVKKVKAFTGRANLELQKETLHKTVDKMLDAFREDNRTEVERCMAVWSRLTGQIPPGEIPQKLIEDVRGPSQWLQEHRQQDDRKREYQEKLNLLEEAFAGGDMNEITAAVGAARRAAENCGEEIPESIKQTYRRIDHDHRSRQRKKTAFKVFLALLIGLLVAGGTGWGIHNSKTKTKIEEDAQRLADLLDSYEGKSEVSDDGDEEESSSAGFLRPDALKQAEKFAEKLQAESPRIAGAAAVTQQLSRMELLVESEAKRSEEFERAKAEAESVVESGDELPEKLLSQLDTLGKTEQERGLVLKIKSLNDKTVRANKEERESQYSRLLAEIKANLDDLEANTVPMDRRAELIDQIKEDLSGLKVIAARGEIPAPLTKNAELFSEKCGAIEKQFRADTQYAADIDAITQAIGDQPRFLDAINLFARKYPNSKHAAEKARIMNCCACYHDVALWNDFIDKVGRRPADWKEAAEFISDFNEIKDQVLFIPDSREVADLVPAVEAIQAIGGRAELAKELIQSFGSCDEECWVWRRYEGDNDLFYYYLTQKPDLSNTGDYMYLTSRKDPGQTAPISTSFTREEIDRIVPAPHFQTALALLERLKDSQKNIDNPVGWCETMIDLLSRLDPEEENKAFDSTVKASLLYAVVDVLKDDPIFADKLLPWKKIFDDDPEFSPDIDWINPENKELPRQRKVASRIFVKLATSPITLSFQTFRDRAAKQADTKVSTYPWVGWLHNEKGEWTVILKEGASVSGDLFMPGPKQGDNPPALVPVGTAAHSTVTLSGNTGSFIIGAPILVRVTDDPSGSR